MTLRVLRRKVIIREYDYNKLVQETSMPLKVGDHKPLYDRSNFLPLSQSNLEKLKVVEILKGKQSPITEVSLNLENPALLLYNLKDHLYNQKYFEWNVDVDSDGYICVQARKNTPKSRLGWAVFEKDLVSRL
jgi:hypothetical protein